MADLPIPPEWAPHRALWTAWPSDAALWEEGLQPAQAEAAALALALVAAGERVQVLVQGRDAMAAAEVAIGGACALLGEPFGDIWLRDTGPIFTRPGHARAFRFNGWGGKYVLAGDGDLADRVAARAGASLERFDFVLEGGAVEMDGAGTLLATRQCLLNPNRNPGWKQADAEAALRAALGAEKVLWLEEGLLNDHTDGHIDNLARFVAPGRVVCQHPVTGDRNAATLEAIARALEAMTDAQGRRLDVTTIPSPGFVAGADGEAAPASHMNFVIANEAVIVPVYSDTGDDALKALAPLFPGRRLIGLSARALLDGGGAFHCITQQEPA